MSTPIGPMRVNEMILNTFRFMRAYPAATLGIGALLATVSATVNGIVMNGIILGSDAVKTFNANAGSEVTTAMLQDLVDATQATLPWTILVLAVSFITQLAALGVMTLAVLRANRGQTVQPAELWREVPWGRLLAINALIVLLVLVAGALPFAVMLFSDNYMFAAMGAMFAIAAVIVFSTALAVPATMNEQLRPRSALARSMALVRGAWWRTAFALFLANLFWTAIGNFIGTPIASIFGAIAGGSRSTFAQVLETLLTNIITGAVTLPGLAVMSTFIYFDRVARTSTDPEQQPDQ